jgi:hypothetical protein
MAEGEGFGLQAGIENRQLIDFYTSSKRTGRWKRGYLVRERYTRFSLLPDRFVPEQGFDGSRAAM